MSCIISASVICCFPLQSNSAMTILSAFATGSSVVQPCFRNPFRVGFQSTCRGDLCYPFNDSLPFFFALNRGFNIISDLLKIRYAFRYVFLLAENEGSTCRDLSQVQGFLRRSRRLPCQRQHQQRPASLRIRP